MKGAENTNRCSENLINMHERPHENKFLTGDKKKKIVTGLHFLRLIKLAVHIISNKIK